MNVGLEGVVVAETRLSRVQGDIGELTIAGRRVEDFSSLSYEEAAGLLLQEELDLGEGRVWAFEILGPHLALLQGLNPVLALRLGLSLLAEETPTSRIVGAIPVILGAIRHGDKLAAPMTQASHCEDFLRLFRGASPPEQDVRALETYLTTVSDHGMNASTFTARVVISTGTFPLDSIIAGLCALKGPLHGGAPGPVLDLLEELASLPGQSDDDLASFISQKIENGERIMGFGHRVYRSRDPRANVLNKAISALTSTPKLSQAQRAERIIAHQLSVHKPNRILETNVEFYTAVLLDQLDFHRSMFTALFAMGRVLGWLAHIKEQSETGRLIRPKARYVGPEPCLAIQGSLKYGQRHDLAWE